MSDDEAELTDITVGEFFASLVDDDDAANARERYCETVATALENVGSWIAIDAWIGAGDVPEPGGLREGAPDPTRRSSFHATGLVAQISAELATGATVLFRNGNEYAASALVRQLIECEYLLRSFRLDFNEASRWFGANDTERWDFSPKKLRKIGGFDDAEYRDHCEMGGHPHPKGWRLLEMPRTVDGFNRRMSGAPPPLNQKRLLWLDFAMHCDRLWRTLSDLLDAENARFQSISRTRASIEAVAASRVEWHKSDPIGRNPEPTMSLFKTDPNRNITELLRTDS